MSSNPRWHSEFQGEGRLGEELCGVVNNVGGHMEFCSNGVCSELRNGNILELVAKDCVPLQDGDGQGQAGVVRATCKVRGDGL